MSVFLNAYQAEILDNQKLKVFSFEFERELLYKLRDEQKAKFSFCRVGSRILAISENNDFTGIKSFVKDGRVEEISVKDNLPVFCFFIRDTFVRLIEKQNRNKPLKYSPIEILSSKPEDNIIASVAEGKLPFVVQPLFSLDARVIQDKIHVVIDCGTKTVITKPCSYFMKSGFNVLGKMIYTDDRGSRTKIGIATYIRGETIVCKDSLKGVEKEVDSNQVYISASKENIDAFLWQSFKQKAEMILFDMKTKISIFSKGENRLGKIKVFRSFLDKELTLLNGVKVKLHDLLEISENIRILENPSFIFFGRNEWHYPDQGISKFGAYSKSDIDFNDPSICVICSEACKGRVEQFVCKFLYGIPEHQRFSKGFQDRFSLGKVKVEYFTVRSDDVDEYQRAVAEAIKKKADEGGRWNLALVQVKKEFKSRTVNDNPYYYAKTTFLTKQIPVQSFTLEMIAQKDYNLGYSLNNMALATYAKMGGIPWLLKSSMIMTHELVIGIGSAYIGKSARENRVMGITTVFSGTGDFMLSGTSDAVPADKYQNALIAVLKNTIEKLKTSMGWKTNDAVRIVFHSSVKPFNREEAEAVKNVLKEYADYQIEYAFLKISYDHPMQIFDDAALGVKGKLGPTRGQSFQVSADTILACLSGKDQLKQESDGHPQIASIVIHRDSTFKDVKYLTKQLFNFTSHSWRCYNPNPLPATIIYSNLIADNLGWFNELPQWADINIVGRIGNTKWFL